MGRQTLPTPAYECVGGPFDGDSIACAENAYVEVGWGGVQQGVYLHGKLKDARVLIWVPARAS
jgi:hypothetical protein